MSSETVVLLGHEQGKHSTYDRVEDRGSYKNRDSVDSIELDGVVYCNVDDEDVAEDKGIIEGMLLTDL